MIGPKTNNPNCIYEGKISYPLRLLGLTHLNVIIISNKFDLIVNLECHFNIVKQLLIKKI
jgi:hypothetical protein